MTAKDIQKALQKHFQNNSLFIVPNMYYFLMDKMYESDLLIFKDNQSVYEIEIKISRSDFLADFKKGKKHLCLESGSYSAHKTRFKSNKKTKKVDRFNKGDLIPIDRPNRFYFAVPRGLIKPDELPSYCGLFYINKDGSVKKIKEGKLLKKEREIDYEKLCKKFYYAWLNSKNKI